MKNAYPYAVPKIQPRWQKQARQNKGGAFCCVHGCGAYATHRVDIEVAYREHVMRKACDSHRYATEQLLAGADPAVTA